MNQQLDYGGNAQTVAATTPATLPCNGCITITTIASSIFCSTIPPITEGGVPTIVTGVTLPGAGGTGAIQYSDDGSQPSSNSKSSSTSNADDSNYLSDDINPNIGESVNGIDEPYYGYKTDTSPICIGCATFTTIVGTPFCTTIPPTSKGGTTTVITGVYPECHGCITITTHGPVPYMTVVPPQYGNGVSTVITCIAISSSVINEFTTITQEGTNTGRITALPPSPGGTGTIITLVPSMTVTTITSVGTATGLTTIPPMTSGGTPTVITFIQSNAGVTITSIASTTGVITIPVSKIHKIGSYC